MSIQIRQTSQGYEGHAVIDTRYGPVIVHASAPTRWVDEALARIAHRRPEVVSGDLWGDLKGAFNEAAKSQVMRDVTNYAAQAARSPLVQSAAKAYSPTAASALNTFADAADAANVLANKAAAGDQRAQHEVRTVTARAAAGDPRAQTAARLVREGLKANQAKLELLRGKIPPLAARQAAPAGPYVPIYPQALPALHANPYASPYAFPEAVQVPFDAYRAQMAPNPYAAPALDPWGRPIDAYPSTDPPWV